MHPVEEMLLHPEERQRISHLGSAAARDHLGSLWVAKEALVKSTGDGLRIDLTQILIRIDGTSASVQSWPSTLALIVPPRVTLFPVSEDVVGALATQR
jgi:phosphopantetheinyl transferase